LKGGKWDRAGNSGVPFRKEIQKEKSLLSDWTREDTDVRVGERMVRGMLIKDQQDQGK